jgi:hypothetical protein
VGHGVVCPSFAACLLSNEACHLSYLISLHFIFPAEPKWLGQYIRVNRNHGTLTFFFWAIHHSIRDSHLHDTRSAYIPDPDPFAITSHHSTVFYYFIFYQGIRSCPVHLAPLKSCHLRGCRGREIVGSEVQHGWMFGVIVYGPSQQTRLGFRELFLSGLPGRKRCAHM